MLTVGKHEDSLPLCFVMEKVFEPLVSYLAVCVNVLFPYNKAFFKTLSGNFPLQHRRQFR